MEWDITPELLLNPSIINPADSSVLRKLATEERGKSRVSSEDAKGDEGRPRAAADKEYVFPAPGAVDTVFFDLGNVIVDCDDHKLTRALAQYSTWPEEAIYNLIMSKRFMAPLATGRMTVREYFEKLGRE